MIGNGSAATALRFEGYRLDLARGCLFANGRAVALRPKSYEVLRYLIENAGRLVSKDELMAAVWPSVVVTDESLAKCISEVRLALGDREQRLIKTVPRRGYLFDAAISELSDPHTAEMKGGAPQAGLTASSGRPPLRMAYIAVGLFILLLAGAALLPRLERAHQAVSDRPSLVVLPFVNSGDAKDEYFADGVTEELTTSLGRFSDLLVIGRNSASTYKDKRVAGPAIGRELGARYLIEGSIRREGDRVRLTAELTEAATGSQLWAERYDSELPGIFSVQDDLTRKIVGRLVARITRAELDRARSKPPASLAAYDYYLRGNTLVERRRGEDRGAMVGEARELFAKAVAADPEYAPAVQGLADSYAIAWLEPTRYEPFRQEFQKSDTRDHALTLAQRAIELDPYLAKAHATLAWILHWQYRRDEALAEFERAMELNPNLIDGRFGLMLAHDGRATEGVELLTRAMRQEPFPPAIYLSYIGNSYFLAGRYDDARRSLEAGIERLPDYRPLHLWLAAAAAQAGHDTEARRAAARALELNPEFDLAKWLQHIRLADPQDAERLGDGIRKAGLH